MRLDGPAFAARSVRLDAPWCWLALAVMSAAGCASRPTEEFFCSASGAISTTREPLNGGAPDAAYLALDQTELEAIVQVGALDGLGQELSTCTGTVIAPTSVLTAAHCDPDDRVTFEVRRVDAHGAVLDVISVVDSQRADAADLLLMHLPTVLLGVTPIPVAARVPDDLLGRRVQVAGTGLAEGENASSRLFSVETVVALSEETITVSAQGYSGACLGDSGGPLLWRGSTGTPEVLGVLSEGSSTCWADDDYVRVDTPGEFFADVLPATSPDAASCGELDHDGRCFGQSAVWCDSQNLVAAECTGDTICGYDTNARGFRCVPPGADPCRGIDDLGECSEGDAVRCEGGRVLRNACSRCRAECVLSPRSGLATCVENR